MNCRWYLCSASIGNCKFYRKFPCNELDCCLQFINTILLPVFYWILDGFHLIHRRPYSHMCRWSRTLYVKYARPAVKRNCIFLFIFLAFFLLDNGLILARVPFLLERCLIKSIYKNKKHMHEKKRSRLHL